MSAKKVVSGEFDRPMDLTVKRLEGADAVDFLSKLEALEIGGVLSLPSVMPGLSNKRVHATLVSMAGTSDTHRQWHFDMYWCDTFIGATTAEQDGPTIGLW